MTAYLLISQTLITINMLVSEHLHWAALLVISILFVVAFILMVVFTVFVTMSDPTDPTVLITR